MESRLTFNLGLHREAEFPRRFDFIRSANFDVPTRHPRTVQLGMRLSF